MGRHAYRETIIRRPALERRDVSRTGVTACDVGYDLTIGRLPRRVEVRPVRLLRRSTPGEGKCKSERDQEETHSPVNANASLFDPELHAIPARA